MIAWWTLLRAGVVTLWVGVGFFVWTVGTMVVWGAKTIAFVAVPFAFATAAIAVLEECGLPRIPKQGVVCAATWGAVALVFQNWHHLTAFGVPKTFPYFVIPWLFGFLVATLSIVLVDRRERRSGR